MNETDRTRFALALQEIAYSDPVDNALDPDRNCRIAWEAIEGGGSSEHAAVLQRLRKAADALDAVLSSYCDGPERDELRAASAAALRYEERE